MKIELEYKGQQYFIIVEYSSFTAYKIVTIQDGKNVGKERDQVIGYYTLLSNDIRKIVQDKMSETDETLSLMAYCERIEEAYTELMLQTQS